MEEKYIKNIDFSEVLELNNLVEYVEGSVESRTLVQREDFSMTLFAFESKEGVSSYTMPGDTMIYVYEGKVEVIINDKDKHVLEKGKTIVVPPDTLHSYEAVERSKILIVIVKGERT
jgi:quercetin dioxygenase-like cupin family protein